MRSKHEPLFFVGGTDDHRRRRFVHGLVTQKRNAGWTVYPLDGGDVSSLEGVLGAAGVLFGGNTLCVVENPEKLPLTLLKSYVEDPDPTVVIVLVSDSDKISAGLSEFVPKSCTKVFSLPAFYKMESHALEYIKGEVKSSGCTLEDNIALALVRKVGTDLGMLTFEIQKAVALAASMGTQVLTSDIVKGSLAPLSETDGSGVLEALANKNAKRIALEMTRFMGARGGDPTIELCGRVLSPAFLRWLQAAYMHENGVSVTAAAGRVGANPWYWENKVLVPAMNWGVGGVRILLSVVARSQTMVFNGGLQPWIVLESGLLGSLLG